jgi:hypothetical protein
MPIIFPTFCPFRLAKAAISLGIKAKRGVTFLVAVALIAELKRNPINRLKRTRRETCEKVKKKRRDDRLTLRLIRGFLAERKGY